MELDSLKETWQKQGEKDLKTKKSDIMELVQHKSYGPVAALKRRVSWQLIVTPLFLAIIGLEIIFKPNTLDELKKLFAEQPFYWLLSLMTIMFFMYSTFNYILVSRLQNADLSVKNAIAKDLKRFENGMKIWRLATFLLQIAGVLFLEFGKHIPGKVFDTWYAVHPLTRYLVYTIAIVGQFFYAKRSVHKQFGQHIDFLKSVLAKME